MIQQPALPRLTEARAELLRKVSVKDQHGAERELLIPHERPLTLFVDRRELVTLMTLGVNPELLTLGYLLNQQFVRRAGEIESITVDWAVHAAAVKTHEGLPELQARTAQRVVTTGCGQGTVFGDALTSTETLAAHARVANAATTLSASTLLVLLETMRQQPNLHRQAGSVHGCALFEGTSLLHGVEDVGRHNAIDTLTGWMAMHHVASDGKLLYTTGRLTSEMVMKAALMGLPVVISRNGVTAMGLELAERLGMTLIGRAVNRHWFCYCGAARLSGVVGAVGAG